jgi:hypothetical protein
MIDIKGVHRFFENEKTKRENGKGTPQERARAPEQSRVVITAARTLSWESRSELCVPARFLTSSRDASPLPLCDSVWVAREQGDFYGARLPKRVGLFLGEINFH